MFFDKFKMILHYNKVKLLNPIVYRYMQGSLRKSIAALWFAPAAVVTCPLSRSLLIASDFSGITRSRSFRTHWAGGLTPMRTSGNLRACSQPTENRDAFSQVGGDGTCHLEATRKAVHARGRLRGRNRQFQPSGPASYRPGAGGGLHLLPQVAHGPIGGREAQIHLLGASRFALALVENQILGKSRSKLLGFCSGGHRNRR